MKSKKYFKIGLTMLIMILTISCNNEIDKIIDIKSSEGIKTSVNTNNKCVDIDGNIYNTITIGDQIWLCENLKTTKYRNGDDILTTETLTINISSDINGKYMWSYPETENRHFCTYYTWNVLNDERQIAPLGWHIPTKEEWKILTTNLLSLPTLLEHLDYGYRCNKGSLIHSSTNETYWWTATEHDKIQSLVQSIKIDNSTSSLFVANKNFGFPILCVKDK
jgi:hypothetical protein